MKELIPQEECHCLYGGGCPDEGDHLPITGTIVFNYCDNCDRLGQMKLTDHPKLGIIPLCLDGCSGSLERKER